MVKHWNRLSRKVVGDPFLETFKVKLDGALSGQPDLAEDAPAHSRETGPDDL